jgi:adhesin/invasin
VNTPALQFTSAQPAAASVAVDPGASGLAWSATLVYQQSPAAWLSITPASGMGATAMQVSVNPAGLVPGGLYRASLVIQSLMSTPQYQTIPITYQAPATGISYLNSASFEAGAAPGMVLSLFDPGVNLAAGTEAAGVLPLPLTMQGTSVKMNGIAAPLYYVSPTQLNVQVPYEVPPGPATLTVSNAGGQIANQSVYVNAVAPGIFLASDRRHIAPSAAATAGGYVTLYLTGQGPVTPAVATGAAPPNQAPVSGLPDPYARVQVLVNGVPAQIAFAGIPYYLVGVAQINFIVPPETPAGDQPVVVTLAGVPSNTGYITVGQ